MKPLLLVACICLLFIACQKVSGHDDYEYVYKVFLLIDMDPSEKEWVIGWNIADKYLGVITKGILRETMGYQRWEIPIDKISIVRDAPKEPYLVGRFKHTFPLVGIYRGTGIYESEKYIFHVPQNSIIKPFPEWDN